MQTDLEAIISRFAADTGTIHLVEDGVLILKAHMGVPAQVLQIIGKIPIGKGMAGPETCGRARRLPVSAARSWHRFATEEATRWARWESASIESMHGATPRSCGCSRRQGGWPHRFSRQWPDGVARTSARRQGSSAQLGTSAVQTRLRSGDGALADAAPHCDYSRCRIAELNWP
jgi:hypothetical protein